MDRVTHNHSYFLQLAVEQRKVEALERIFASEPALAPHLENQALIYACDAGADELVLFLLDSGADANYTSFDDAGRAINTPLIAAARRGRESTVKILLDRGVDVSRELYDHSSALSTAISHPRIIKLLISAGVDLQSTMAIHTLYAAVVNYEQETAMCLLNAGVNCKDEGARSVLSAALISNVDIAFELLQRGAQPSVDDRGCTALHQLMLNTMDDVSRVREMASSLVRLGVRLDGVNNEGDAALHFAPDQHLSSLLELGADVNIVSCDNTTRLHRAFNENSNQAVTLLLAYGADIHVGNPSVATIAAARSPSATRALVLAHKKMKLP